MLQGLINNVEGDRSIYVETDITNYDTVTASYNTIVSQIGHPSILVANAGYVQGRTLINASPEAIARTFAVNVLGAIYPIKVAIPHMITANRGHILFTVSTTGISPPPCGATDYTASKAAVTRIMQGLQTELKHKHGNPAVKVSAIFPHTIGTALFEGIDKSSDSFLVPMLRPADVAACMANILSAGYRYVKSSRISLSSFSGSDSPETWITETNGCELNYVAISSRFHQVLSSSR